MGTVEAASGRPDAEPDAAASGDGHRPAGVETGSRKRVGRRPWTVRNQAAGEVPVEPGGLLAGPERALTVGMVALMALAAFEYLAVATAMPTVARALDGLALYPLAFGGPLAAGVVGMVVSGGWSDGKGPAGPVWG
ncbi:MAG: hypothetical protein M3Q10_07385, partial [Chloroflexota bacterium]|nr:hypothetical protein [Chloroflexota bacterium]